MSTSHELSNFIRSIADLLRGPYRPPQYERVMLPLVVLRRLDCVLESTKQAALECSDSMAPKASNIEFDETPVDNQFDGKRIDCETNAALHNFESVPLTLNVDEHFAREVLPHMPDTWVAHDKTQVSDEINFNCHVYLVWPPRLLTDVTAPAARP